MPGIVGFYALILAGIAGVVAAAIVYWLLKFTKLRFGAMRGFLALSIGLATAGLIIWDFERLQTYELSGEVIESTLQPVLANGATLKESYAFSEGLSYRAYYLVSVPEVGFRSFISDRPHEPSDDPALLIGGPAEYWGPDWIKKLNCQKRIAYQPNFAASSLPIDDFDLHYCPETEELLIVKVRV